MVASPPHIVIDARSMFTSTGRYTRNLIAHLERIDTEHRYTVVLPRDRLDDWTPTNPLFRAAPTDTPYFSWREQTTFGRELRALRPDLVHFAMPQQPLFLGARRVTTFLDLTLLKVRNRKKHWATSAVKRVIGAGAFVVAAHRSRVNLVISAHGGRDLIAYTRVRPQSLRLTSPAADLLPHPAAEVAQPFPRFVLFVGRQEPYKNLRRLIRAVADLRAAGHAVGLVVAGAIDDDGARLIAALDDRQREAVHFTGFVDDAGLRWLYENAAVFAFPSFFEGFGLPGLEAMRHGCAVVSSNSTCLPEVYGAAAVYFDPARTQEMREAIERVLTDDELAAALRERGHARARLFSWEEMAERTLDAYRDALAP